MTKQNANQYIQKIKADLQDGQYSLKKVVEGERNPSREKRIKRLQRKIKKAEKEMTEEKILLFFELGKELGDKRMDVRNKNYRLIA